MKILDCDFRCSTYSFELTVNTDTTINEDELKALISQKIKDLFATMGYTYSNNIIEYKKFIILDDKTLLCYCIINKDI